MIDPPAGSLRGLSSMATRAVLADLAVTARTTGVAELAVTSVGGVQATQRLRDGDPVDVVVLAAEAVRGLAADGLVVAGTCRGLFDAELVAAVPAAGTVPDLTDGAGLRRALRSARAIGYSTGPSGAAVLALIHRWQLADELAGRLVQAPPGVPVGSLLQRGAADLGFQQRSELLGLPGVRVLGLPPGCRVTTTFAGVVGTRSAHPALAAELLDFLGSPAAAPIVRRRGLAPAHAGTAV